MEAIYQALGVEQGDLSVRAIHFEHWGRRLVFACRYRAGDQAGDFTMTFEDCRELRWRVYVHAEPQPEAAIADFKPGRDRHRSPAHLLTDYFGLSLVYGSLEIRSDGDAVSGA